MGLNITQLLTLDVKYLSSHLSRCDNGSLESSDKPTTAKYSGKYLRNVIYIGGCNAES